MLKTRQPERLTPESHETLLTILETLPGALFVLDDAATIIYANASAQALTGVAPETLVGNSFWRCAPQVVSTVLYQAIQKTKQPRALTEVQYVSSVTQRWLHVHLSSTSGGLTLQFHEMGAPASWAPGDRSPARVPLHGGPGERACWDRLSDARGDRLGPQ
ncbi:hypothetical protein KSC_107400 [Ktedonobacter sp. SOSP1-52]|nr:hypothetical protein KSC_107400 [Ktedonobacter sp. SOSP1-52]